MKSLSPVSSSPARAGRGAARRLSTFALAGALLGALALGGRSARADAINIDFNSVTVTTSPGTFIPGVGSIPGGSTTSVSPTYSGIGAAPDTGTRWNGVNVNGFAQNQNSGALVNSNGAATSVTLTTNSVGVMDSPNGVGANNHAAKTLLEEFIFTDTTARTVTLNGLTAGTNYNLYLYGVGSNALGTTNGLSRSAFTVNGVTQSTSGPNAATTNFTLGEDYVMFNNLSANNNSISISYAAFSGETRGVFNGLQLQFAGVAPVPEPSTWAMMALGVGALGLIARRKREEHSEGEAAV